MEIMNTLANDSKLPDIRLTPEQVYIDRLRAVNAELLAALQVIETGFSDGSIKWTKPRQADNEPYHTANVLMTAALAKAQQS